VRVVDQVADALVAAHSEGLVHRDVKPGNVLMSPATPPAKVGHVYLADFGLTKKSLSGSGLTRSGQFVGTTDYVAPEQIRAEPVDGRADVYSLGCVLYECLTGEPPFVRDVEVAVMFAQLNDAPPRPTDARPELPKAMTPWWRRPWRRRRGPGIRDRETLPKRSTGPCEWNPSGSLRLRVRFPLAEGADAWWGQGRASPSSLCSSGSSSRTAARATLRPSPRTAPPLPVRRRRPPSSPDSRASSRSIRRPGAWAPPHPWT
jgi:serine/threonine protein kinase